MKLSAGSLQDLSYYELVSDGFQRLCNASDIMPCVLDAIIFASFDDGKWTKRQHGVVDLRTREAGGSSAPFLMTNRPRLPERRSSPHRET